MSALRERSLEALLDEVTVDRQTPNLPAVPRQPIQKVRYTHDAMIDLIIANPAVSQNELARAFGYTPSWVSQVISSDAFQSRLADRTAELVDPTIRQSVEERFKGLVLRSLEILSEKLNKPTEQIPDQLALRALEIASRAAGYGGKAETSKQEVNVNLHLEQLSGNLVQLLRRRRSEVPATLDPGEALALESGS